MGKEKEWEQGNTELKTVFFFFCLTVLFMLFEFILVVVAVVVFAIQSIERANQQRLYVCVECLFIYCICLFIFINRSTCCAAVKWFCSCCSCTVFQFTIFLLTFNFLSHFLNYFYFSVFWNTLTRFVFLLASWF